MEANDSKDSTNNENERKLEAVASLCSTLERNLREMGKALNCPLCLSSYQDAVVLPCVHSYCRQCLLQALGTNKPLCPLCNARATKRSINSAPVLNQLVKGYKKALRHFGLAPVQFDPSYVAMTQLAPEEEASDTEQSSYTTGGQSLRRRRSESFLDRHHDFQVSKTWQKVYEFEQTKNRNDNDGKCDSTNDDTPSKLMAIRPDQSTVAVRVVVPGLPPKPAMPANPTATRQWQRQQQEQIINANRRALIEAAKKRIEPSPVLNLSMQQELGMELAIDQEVENRAGEQWLEEVDLQQQQKVETEQNENTQAIVFLTRREAESYEYLHSSKSDAAAAVADTRVPVLDDALGEEDPTWPQACLTAAASFDTNGNDKQHRSTNNVQNIHKPTPKILTGSQQGKTSPDADRQEPTTAVRSNRTTACVLDKPTPTVLVQLSDNSLLQGPSDEQKTMHLDPGGTTTEDPYTVTVVNNGTCVTCLPQQTLERDNNQSSLDQENADTASMPSSRFPTRNRSTNGDTAGAVGTSPAPFQTGDVVQVQARTWPGVNKPGGVARITKVTTMDSAAGCHAYDVQYIMGGREKNVDSTFVSWPNGDLRLDENDDHGSDTGNTSHGRNWATRQGRKSRRQQQKDRLPLQLLAELAAQGFDTTGQIDFSDFAPTHEQENCQQDAGSRSRIAVRKRIKTEAKERTQEEDDKEDLLEMQPNAKRARNSSASILNRTMSKTPRPPKSAGPSSRPTKRCRVTNTEKQEVAHDDRAIEIAASASATGRAPPGDGKGKAPVVASTGPAPRRASSQTDVNISLGVMSNETKCQRADVVYLERIKTAMESSVVYIIASSLVGSERAALRSLCDETKNSPVRIKVIESFYPQKTTLCVLPVAANSGSQLDLIGKCRTVKAMRAALAGIPIVSPEWIRVCLNRVHCSQKLDLPSPSMFIRSLPIKSSNSEAQAKTQFGVAAIAASKAKNKTLSDCVVHLCGEFARPPKGDVEVLLRDAGATIYYQASSARAQLKHIGKVRMQVGSSPVTKLVILCDDSTDDDKCGISGRLYLELKTALQRTSGTDSQQVFVVGFQWLFDSVVAGCPMPPTCYEPRTAKARTLWRLQRSASVLCSTP